MHKFLILFAAAGTVAQAHISLPFDYYNIPFLVLTPQICPAQISADRQRSLFLPDICSMLHLSLNVSFGFPSSIS